MNEESDRMSKHSSGHTPHAGHSGRNVLYFTTVSSVWRGEQLSKPELPKFPILPFNAEVNGYASEQQGSDCFDQSYGTGTANAGASSSSSDTGSSDESDSTDSD